MGAGIVVGVVANLIVFIALVDVANSSCEFFGDMAGVEDVDLLVKKYFSVFLQNMLKLLKI